MSSLGPGLRLHDRYRLVTLLGEGGMSQVWRAVDEVLGRPVAVKVLAAPHAGDPVLQSSTWREARVAAQLAHPHVTQVYDYGEATLAGTTVSYLVLELVEGQSLADRIASGPLPWPEAARVGAQIAGALAAAHRLGLVHRDVKPGNVMLTPNGAKVLDFGIAALAGPGLDGGRLIGTPVYAAPERARPGAAEPAGDVYALGAVLYEMLTGRPPREVNGWADVSNPVGAIPPPAARGLPPRLAGVCLDCLATDPNARPGAVQVAAILDELGIRGAMPVSPARSAPVATPTRVEWAPPPAAAPVRSQRRTGLIAVIGAALLAGLVFALVALLGPGAGAGEPDANQTTTPVVTRTTDPVTTTPPPAGDTPAAKLAILQTIRDFVDDAADNNRMSNDAADEVRDKLDDMRERLERDRPRDIRDRAGDLQKKINDMHQDGEINDAIAAQLVLLLKPLAGNG